jgi:hypothetical protein
MRPPASITTMEEMSAPGRYAVALSAESGDRKG